MTIKKAGFIIAFAFFVYLVVGKPIIGHIGGTVVAYVIYAIGEVIYTSINDHISLYNFLYDIPPSYNRRLMLLGIKKEGIAHYKMYVVLSIFFIIAIFTRNLLFPAELIANGHKLFVFDLLSAFHFVLGAFLCSAAAFLCRDIHEIAKVKRDLIAYNR